MKRTIAAAVLALLPLTAGATNLVIPASGTGPGANGSTWQTEVTLHNSTSRTASVIMTFHDQQGAGLTFTQIVGPRRTVAISDIVRTIFNRQSATGAIEIVDTDSDPRNLAVTSRTSNRTANGELGQDIPAVEIASAAKPGDVIAITGPSSVAAFRFNFGLYAVADATVRWELVRAGGTTAASKDVDYDGGTQIQYNGGVSSLFGVTPEDSDVVHASVTKGSAVFYGSVVEQQSGDPSFVPGILTRVDPRLRFLGVDRNENGTVDVADANNDGVLDGPIESYTFGFPTFFRIVVEAEGNEAVTFEIVSSTADARLIDDRGTVQLVASAALKGTTGELKVRVTAAGQSSVLTIPVKFL